MLHMLFGLFLALTVSAIASDKTTTIRISGNSNIVFTDEYKTALFIAANNACLEMHSSHGLPFPGNKEKRKKVQISGQEMTLEHVSKGICRYSFANLYISYAIDGANYAAGIFHRKNAGDEAKIICKTPSAGDRYLQCRTPEGKYGAAPHLYLNMENNNDKTIHFELE